MVLTVVNDVIAMRLLTFLPPLGTENEEYDRSDMLETATLGMQPFTLFTLFMAHHVATR